MSKRVLCKFFAHGACLKGEHCEYSHDWKDPPNNICTFYQKGFCAYGSRCRYQHVKAERAQSSASSSSTISQQFVVSDSTSLPHSSSTSSKGIAFIPGAVSELSALSRPFVLPKPPAWKQEYEQSHFLDGGDVGETSVTPADLPICSFAAAGDCPRGEKCPHVHGDLCPTCGKHCLHPFRPDEKEEHLRTCNKKHKHLEALKHSQEIECSVCLERVLSKPTAAERKFGLMSECDHPFCISCIRNWRSSSPTSGFDVNSALRACPICRKLSYFVVPSVIWYTSKEEKQEIVNSYKAKLKSIDCKHFDFGNGNCPFGTSCFYRHTVKPGSYVWKHHRPPPRRPTPRRSNVVEMDALLDMFEHLDEMECYSPEDLDSEDTNPWEMGLLFSLMGFDTSDSSSDEEFIF
ncbi:Cdk-activating kinase assembly factor [Trema orientale]|uniref:Cdk-activating kinase assembly factor n=1 Tax=Trema orientale TaxID=63057 RepID=A0A2P5E715_TREOI|nr:Cdk-activating kinase assembly factor [Trema orientale]